jgi:hypothetical protein
MKSTVDACEYCDRPGDDCTCGTIDCRNCGRETAAAEIRENGGICNGCVDPVHGEGE